MEFISTRTKLQEMINMTKRRLALPSFGGSLVANLHDDRGKTE